MPTLQKRTDVSVRKLWTEAVLSFRETSITVDYLSLSCVAHSKLMEFHVDIRFTIDLK